uniref:G_PROTEIN_RECEP_F1_2 domain-containing protein n=1 Tax=Panagrellus redivivus TaxID=6233 RepID=A0A7E4URT9_PANRE
MELPVLQYAGGDLASLRLNLTYFNYDGPRRVTSFDISANQNRMYVSFGVNLASFCGAVYLVLRHSPKDMGIYKYLLLNIIIWSFLMDTSLTLLWMPYVMMPAPAICTTGLLRGFGVYGGSSLCFVIFMFCFSGCNISCGIAQFFRFLAVRPHGQIKIFRNTRFLFGVAMIYVFTPIPVILAYFYSMEYDYDGLQFFLTENFPFTRSIVLKVPCGGFIIDGHHYKYLVFFGTGLLCMLICMTSSVALLTSLLKSLKRQLKTSVAMKGAKQQRQLYMALLFQTLLPTLCLGLPYSLLVVESLINNDVLGYLSHLFLAVGSLHSFFNVTVLIFMIKPYKMAVFSRIPMLRKAMDSTIEIPTVSQLALRQMSRSVSVFSTY